MPDKHFRERPLIYVCSPLRGLTRGETERHLDHARDHCHYVYEQGGLPIAPHVMFTPFLLDHIAKERKAGMEMGLQLLSICDELWAFGYNDSPGMIAEINQAQRVGLVMRRFNRHYEKLEVAEPPERLRGYVLAQTEG